jgi:hypothetical protein
VQPNGVLAAVRIVNRWMTQVSVDVRWRIGADFADFDEVEGERKQNAEAEVTSMRDGVRFRYMHPQLPFETHVIAENGGIWSYSDGALGARLDLERQAEGSFDFGSQPWTRGTPPMSVDACAEGAFAAVRAKAHRRPRAHGLAAC